MSSITARFLAASKVKVSNGYNWSLKNQTLASGGLMFMATTTCTAIAMFGYRLGVHDIKDEAAVTRRHFDGKFAELGEKVAKVGEKVAKVEEANMQTQRIVWTCAAATWKGFKGDTTAIENFVQSVDTFDKIIDCVKKGEC